jgi:hypothetical protein
LSWARFHDPYMPKVGSCDASPFDNPTAQTEDLHLKSLNRTVDRYQAFTDNTYAQPLSELSERKFDLTAASLHKLKVMSPAPILAGGPALQSSSGSN